jgi:hypothetical protein
MNIFKKIMVILLPMLFSMCVFAQSVDQSRYLVVDDLTTFFSGDDCDVTCNFQLYNIKEDESSKPIYISVSELNNVIDFSIESGSSNYENQRKCTLLMCRENYEETFRLVLYNLKVKYIIYKGNNISSDSFYLLLKQN